MNTEAIAHFVRMGGHGLYIWGAYAVTLALLLGEAWAVRRRHGRALGPPRSSEAFEAFESADAVPQVQR